MDTEHPVQPCPCNQNTVARQCLAHSGMKHAGNPVARNRAGAKFDEIAA